MKKIEVIEGFSCLEFKAAAQEQLRRATEGMSPEQELRYLRETAARGKLADWFAALPEMTLRSERGEHGGSALSP